MEVKIQKSWQIFCQRKEINELPFRNHNRQKEEAFACAETSHAVFGEGFAKELTAEPQ